MTTKAIERPCLKSDTLTDHPTEQIKLEDHRMTNNEFGILTRHHDGWYTVTHPGR
jgi:hypothetical protein